jgi:hypothetical protein
MQTHADPDGGGTLKRCRFAPCDQGCAYALPSVGRQHIEILDFGNPGGFEMWVGWVPYEFGVTDVLPRFVGDKENALAYLLICQALGEVTLRFAPTYLGKLGFAEFRQLGGEKG